MTRAGALALVAVAVFWVRQIGAAPATDSAGTTLALGFVLLGAWLAGDVIRRLQLPRLAGYLMFGVVVGPYLGNVISSSMAGQLQFITRIATTLIAFMAGLALSVDRLGAQLRPVMRLTARVIAVPLAGLLVLGWAAWPWLGLSPDAAGVERLAMLFLVVVMIVSFSPTMTAAVIADAGARGRLSDLVMAVVVLADLALLALFSVALQIARAVLGGDVVSGSVVIARVVWEIGGALAFGALVGALFALYMRYIGREIALVLLGLCAVLSQVGSTQAFEPLLAAVAAGLVVENVSVAQGEMLRGAVREGATPVLVVFFVAVGASLRLDALTSVGLLSIAVVVLRVLLVRLGVRAGVRGTGIGDDVGAHLWTGLVSQAGITLGLAAIVATEFGAWGSQVQLLLVGVIAIQEIVGPVLFRQGLRAAGDLDPSPVRPLVVVSNREPYLHQHSTTGDIVVKAATGGVAVALDALMRERQGIWIAHGAGEADRQVVDAHDVVRVPPDRPSYALRRLWIEEPTFSAYYVGFANEGLWPLCHVVDVRPRFRAEDWAAYCDVNDRFAAAIHEQVTAPDTPIFIQDYHLALVAPALRRRRPSVRTALFWHIPWPYPDRLRICPWQREILEGLLANDLIAFQLERDRRNFLAAVDEELDVEIEHEASRVAVNGRHCTVVSVPIGVDYDRIQALASDPALVHEQGRLRTQLGLGSQVVGLGVDRLDYTKGIPERLAAIERLVSIRPALAGRFTFVQIGVPSRSELESYASVEAEIGQMVADINARHRVPGGVPLISYHTTPLNAFSLVALYRLAHLCVVSSLHDGMNLVAKEFVAARDDEQGVLVLSSMAGAAQELSEALIINPYDLHGFADALAQAIDMPRDEQIRRMRTLRKVVAGRDVFRWASDILEGLESLWTRPLIYSVRGWEDTSV